MNAPSTELDLDRIRDLLCCAFEGGSNDWYYICDYQAPPADKLRLDWQLISELEKRVGQKPQCFPHLDYPVSEGGALVITSLEGDEIRGATRWRLDLETIQRGMKVFREKYPRHYDNWIAENDDAETGDVFLQCCLFGEVVYS